VPWILSEPVADVASAVDKLRADDRLITDGTQRLNEVEAVVDAVNGPQNIAFTSESPYTGSGCTSMLAGRSTKNCTMHATLDAHIAYATRRSAPMPSEVVASRCSAVIPSAAAIASAPMTTIGVLRRIIPGKQEAAASPSQAATAASWTTPSSANGTAGAMKRA